MVDEEEEEDDVAYLASSSANSARMLLDGVFSSRVFISVLKSWYLIHRKSYFDVAQQRGTSSKHLTLWRAFIVS